MLSLIVLLFTYRLYIYLSQCLEHESHEEPIMPLIPLKLEQLVYWDSAIEMDDDSIMSDSNEMDSGENTDHNNLIVNYLPETTSQADLQSMFQGFGEIESCKLIRHKMLGHSLGYGFVKFKRHEDAQAAIDRLNGLMMQNKKLKVSFARPANDPIKTANLYISGLKNTITEAELVGIFSPFGKVLTVKVMHNDNDPTKTMAIGFVRFERHANAQAAVDELNNKQPSVNPGVIHVSFAKQSREKDGLQITPPIPPVGFSHPSYSQPPFPASRFGNFGKTPSIMGGKNLRFDPLSRGNINRGMGDSLYSVQDGYPSDTVMAGGHVLFVFNLSPEVEELHLWRLFGPYGAIRSVNIVIDKNTNRSKGFAFITMSNYAEAENAICSLNQTMLEGKVLQVSFKKAKTPK